MIAIISFLLLLVCIGYFISKMNKIGISSSDLFNHLKSGLTNSDTKNTKLAKLRLFVMYVTLLIFIIMLLSSFVPTGFTGEHLSGLFLIIHVTLAPIFAICLVILLLLYAHKLQLSESDFDNLGKSKNESPEANNSKIKLTFWLLSLVSIPLLLSVILIFYPILGTESQNMNIIVHRVSALLFTVLVLFFIYITFSSKNNVKT